MTQDEIIIYGFNLENSDPKFQEFVYSLSSYDIHNLRKILHNQKCKASRNGVGATLWGRDKDGIVAVPHAAKKRMWKESDDELFDFIKNIWVAYELGYSDPGMNPIKLHQWKVTRTRAITSRNEGWNVIISTAIEVGVAYFLQMQAFRRIIPPKDRFMVKEMRDSAGCYDGFSISKGAGYGRKKRFDFHTTDGVARPRNSLLKFIKGRRVPHYHRGNTKQKLDRHRPWEHDPFDTSFFDRF